MQFIDSLERLIRPTITAMGYELVGVEKTDRGLLRVLLDKPPAKAIEQRSFTDKDAILIDHDSSITIADCEQVNTHLSHLLAVENIAYEYLEISSAGLDRPLRTESDYLRFNGKKISLKLNFSIKNFDCNYESNNHTNDLGRRNYIGTLRVSKEVSQVNQLCHDLSNTNSSELIMQLELPDNKFLKFNLADVEKACLVPIIDFKSNKAYKNCKPSKRKVK